MSDTKQYKNEKKTYENGNNSLKTQIHKNYLRT